MIKIFRCTQKQILSYIQNTSRAKITSLLKPINYYKAVQTVQRKNKTIGVEDGKILKYLKLRIVSITIA